MRQAALAANDVQRMAAWAGQSAALARPEPASDFVRRIWAETQSLIPGEDPAALSSKSVQIDMPARTLITEFAQGWGDIAQRLPSLPGF